MIPVASSIGSSWSAPLLSQPGPAPLLFGSYNYRPMEFYFLYSLYALFGYNPVPYHIAKSIAHGLLALVFYLLIKEMTGSSKFAFVASIFYSMSGSAVYSSMWITNFETIAEIFFIGGLVMFLKYLRKSGEPGSVTSGYLLLLGLVLATLFGSWFKDTGRGLPLVLVGYTLFFVRTKATRALLVSLALSLLIALFPSFIPMFLNGNFTASGQTGLGASVLPLLLQNAEHNLVFVLFQVGSVSALLGLLCLKYCGTGRLRLVGLPAVWFLATFLPTSISQAPRLDLVLAPTTAIFAAVLVLTYAALIKAKSRRNRRLALAALLIYALLVQGSWFVFTDQVWGTYWSEGKLVQDWAFANIRNATVVFDSAVGENDAFPFGLFNSVTYTQNLNALTSGQPPIYACTRTQSALQETIAAHQDSYSLVYSHEKDVWYVNLDPGRWFFGQGFHKAAVIVHETFQMRCWLKTGQLTFQTMPKPAPPILSGTKAELPSKLTRALESSFTI